MRRTGRAALLPLARRVLLLLEMAALSPAAMEFPGFLFSKDLPR
jgi:hypothetical protein